MITRVHYRAHEHPLILAADAWINQPLPAQENWPKQTKPWTVTDRIMKRTLNVARDSLWDELEKRAGLQYQIEQIDLVIASRSEEVSTALAHLTRTPEPT